MDDRIKRVMASVFGVEPESIGDKSSPDTISSWDSLRHMTLVIALEEEFGCMIDDERIAEMLTFPLIRAVIAESPAGLQGSS